MNHFVISNQIDQFKDHCVLPLDTEKCQTIRGFYETVADVLEFPDYFGFNLDAFDEMINDLSWLEDHHLVLWIKDSTNFLTKERNQDKVLSLLALIEASAEDWQWADNDDDLPKKEIKLVFGVSEHIENTLNKAEIGFDKI
jgi:RNAse (barnase) inhibitor barstar